MSENEQDKEKKVRKKRKLSGRILNIKQFLQMQHTDVSYLLSEDLRAALGEIEDGFDIFIFGNTGEGKSSFAAQVIFQLAPLGRVLHIVYEEGHSKSVKMNTLRSKLSELTDYQIMDYCNYDDLVYLLSKKKAPKIVVIDSFQYARFTKEEWLSLKARFVKGRKKRIIIVISHADGKNPRGSVATDAMYDAQIKVFIKGKIAFIKSRYEGKRNYVVYEDGAKAYWGKRYKSMLTKQIF